MQTTSADDLARELASLSRDTTRSRAPELLAIGLREGCWIYGAGGYGRTIRQLLIGAGFTVRGFVDRRGAAADGDGSLGAPVLRPDEVEASDAGCTALVLGVHSYLIDQQPIVAWARQAGFRDVLVPTELVGLLGTGAGSYWLTDHAHIVAHADAVGRLWSRLADDRSRDVVAGLARFRATGDPRFHPASCLDDQYFPDDLPPLPAALSLLDGGAYVGDTHAAALRNGVAVDRWFAFEPAPENFAALTRYAASHPLEQAALFPCGLSDRFQVLRFAGDAGAGSRAVADGDPADTMVHVVAADDVLRGSRPDLVKLDVEGFERQALDGMRTMIARDRPRLAVSIYHQPADLWELPDKVAAMLPDADLYVRQHGFSGFDTVLYAVPR